MTATDQRQREVGEWREVARRTDAPLRGHDRVEAALEEGEQAIDDNGPAAAVAERQGIGAEQEHRPDDFAGEWFADTRRMAHQQVLLQLGRAGRLDERCRQVAEAGGDAVHDRTLGHEGLDDRTCFVHAPSGVDVEGGPRSAAGNGLDVADG